jgi:single-stranded DNA-binding protein
MNSCILMVEIYDAPQLRHTPDGLEITEMIVHIPGIKPDDPSHPLKVVSWGNLAKEVHENYNSGDRVIIEGRLGMNTFERPEGFKEKRAELTVQRIHIVSRGLQTSQPVAAQYTQVAPVATPAPLPTPAPVPAPPVVTTTVPPQQPTPEPTYQPTYQPVTEPEPDPDDIPF